MAPPLKEINPREVELLASCMCTNEEIAAKLGCSSDTLTRRYAEFLEKGRKSAKASLRAMQFNLAKKNAAMAIWLGKQYLNQRDVRTINLNELTPEQALAILEEADRGDSGSDEGE